MNNVNCNSVKFYPLTEKYLLDVLTIEKQSFPKPWSKEMFEREISLPISRFFVAVEDTDVVGYIGFWIVENEAHLLDFAVHPSFRNKGYGKSILAYIVEKAKEEGAEKLFLEVRKKNVAARKLYLSAGFNESGERKNYYEDDDAVLMDKKLI